MKCETDAIDEDLVRASELAELSMEKRIADVADPDPDIGSLNRKVLADAALFACLRAINANLTLISHRLVGLQP